jgi:hypothetical protein
MCSLVAYPINFKTRYWGVSKNLKGTHAKNRHSEFPPGRKKLNSSIPKIRIVPIYYVMVDGNLWPKKSPKEANFPLDPSLDYENKDNLTFPDCQVFFSHLVLKIFIFKNIQAFHKVLPGKAVPFPACLVHGPAAFPEHKNIESRGKGQILLLQAPCPTHEVLHELKLPGSVIGPGGGLAAERLGSKSQTGGAQLKAQRDPLCTSDLRWTHFTEQLPVTGSGPAMSGRTGGLAVPRNITIGRPLIAL